MSRKRKQRKAQSQDKIVQFIIEFKRDRQNDGNTPTYQEIADGVGLSLSVVYRACTRLVMRDALKLNDRGKLTVPRGKWDIESEDIPQVEEI